MVFYYKFLSTLPVSPHPAVSHSQLLTNSHLQDNYLRVTKPYQSMEVYPQEYPLSFPDEEYLQDRQATFLYWEILSSSIA